MKKNRHRRNEYQKQWHLYAHEELGNDAPARDAYARELAAIEPAITEAEAMEEP